MKVEARPSSDKCSFSYYPNLGSILPEINGLIIGGHATENPPP